MTAARRQHQLSGDAGSLQCRGNEARLGDCPRKWNPDWGEHNCNYIHESVYVQCSGAISGEVGVYTSTQAITVTEDQPPRTYWVRLTSEPSDTVTLTPATTSTAVSLSPATLTFTPSAWDTQQEVTVTVVVDDDFTGHTATVTHSAAGADYEDVVGPEVTVTVLDPDTRGAEVDPRRLEVDEADPAGARYSIRLKRHPTGTARVTVAVPQGAPIQVSPATLDFTRTDWNTAQEVTVTALDDADHASASYTVTHSAAGGGYGGIAIDDVEVRVSLIDRPTIVAGGVQVTSTPQAASDTYGSGETIELTVTFDEAVTVDTVSGVPRIQFRLGPPRTDRWAEYSGGSGNTALTFTYEVQPGDTDSNGIWLPKNELQLQGGAIRDAATDAVDAALGYARAGLQSGHKVDGSLIYTPAKPIPTLGCPSPDIRESYGAASFDADLRIRPGAV